MFNFSNKVAFRAVTKNAHTTMRHVFEQVYGKKETDRTIDFECIKVCIKRDPIDRFLSAFTYLSLTRKNFPKDINKFIDNFDLFKEDEHFKSQTYFLGDKKIYNYVFDIDKTNECIIMISDMINIPLDILHDKQTKHIDVSSKQVDSIKLLEHIKQDYTNEWH